MRNAFAALFVLALVVGAALGLAQLGGTVEVKVGDYWVGISFPIAVLLLVLAFLLGHGLLAAWAALRRWPARRRAAQEARRRTQGEAMLTRALVSLAAGHADAARLEMRRARGLLGETPNLLLLSAEAERLAGRVVNAGQEFQALAKLPEARFLGLRGLLRQAMQRQDWDAALALARDAEAAQPGAAWLREERAQLAVRTGNWREALALAAPEAPRAGLALAAAAQEPDPARALELERQAFEADPGFAPATLAYALRLRENGSPRRARAVLEQGWQAGPHPDLAAPWLAEEPDPLHQVKLAEDLVRKNPTHPESRLLLARVALQAGLTGRARAELEALVQAGVPDRRAGGAPDRRAWLLLAELEEAEQGETVAGRAAQGRWLREAARAAPEPSWRCGHCGTSHAGWAPVCDHCGAAGEISWTSQATAPVAT
jgi:HemY protein